MTDRPTPEQVDEALGSADVHDDYVWAFAVKVLAAEVRALRNETVSGESWRELLADQLKETRRSNSLHVDKVRVLEAENDRLRAILARVKALPDKWLDDVAYQRESVPDCAADLERALRDEP